VQQTASVSDVVSVGWYERRVLKGRGEDVISNPVQRLSESPLLHAPRHPLAYAMCVCACVCVCGCVGVGMVGPSACRRPLPLSSRSSSTVGADVDDRGVCGWRVCHYPLTASHPLYSVCPVHLPIASIRHKEPTFRYSNGTCVVQDPRHPLRGLTQRPPPSLSFSPPHALLLLLCLLLSVDDPR
jgi:hypothetical protein